jgi:peptidoglycan biosynthesis protein MviN/MurJ (putative lipid II flippase)
MLMLNRAFFSLQSNWLPTLVALGNLGVNAALDAAFYRLGIWGIPLSTSFVNIAGTATLLVLLRRRLGRIDGGEIASSFVRVTCASALAGAAAFGVWWAIDAAAGRSLAGQLASLLPALAVAVAVYFGACRALQVREIQTLLSLRGRVRGA